MPIAPECHRSKFTVSFLFSFYASAIAVFLPLGNLIFLLNVPIAGQMNACLVRG